MNGNGAKLLPRWHKATRAKMDKLTTVILVINPELGWDNIVSVYDANFITMEEVEAHYGKELYGFVTRELHTKIEIDD